MLEETINNDVATYQYFNNYTNYRTIIFNSEIDASIVESVILPLKEFESDECDDTVTLILSTPGGSLADGLVLCNIIDNYTKPLQIIVLGQACSLGTIVLCSGNKNPNVTKYCYPFSFALFHAGYTGFEGDVLTISDQVEFNNKMFNKIKKYVVSNTNITNEQYEATERKQWYLFAEDMKQLGLIDHIIGEKENES